MSRAAIEERNALRLRVADLEARNRALADRLAEAETEAGRLKSALRPFGWAAGMLRRTACSITSAPDTEPDDTAECEVLTIGGGSGYQTLRMRHFDAARTAVGGEENSDG